MEDTSVLSLDVRIKTGIKYYSNSNRTKSSQTLVFFLNGAEFSFEFSEFGELRESDKSLKLELDSI